MANIEETLSNYEAACKEEEVAPNEFIVKVLVKQKNVAPADQPETFFLKLCGNNHLMTQVRLTDDDLLPLCESLKENSFVGSLDLRYNRITDVGARRLARLLLTNRHLRELNLLCNDISEEGGAAIAEALESNGTLQVLHMTGNKIGNRGGMAFAQALQVNEGLEQLDLGECDLRIDSVIALATVLNYNTTVRGLNVNRPLLWTQQEEPTVHMADMLKRNRTFEELHMAKYDMRDFGCARICEAIEDNFHLTVLDLSSNRITRDGAKHLARVLKANTSLRVLDLSCNRIQDPGAKVIAEALATLNTNLKALVVSFNEMGGEGLCALADCLKFNSTLTCIYIWGNNLEESACTAFAELLGSYRLYEADVDVRPYEVDGRVYLARLPHDEDYRRYRFAVPIYGSDVPKDASYALF